VHTAQLAGFEPAVDENLVEWDYGELEGLTTEQIRGRFPGWTIWEGPWPGGEQPEQVAARAQKVAERARALPSGSKALVFAHAHVLRVLAACWLGQPATDGRFLSLGTATVSVLGWEHGQPAVEHWNVPSGFPSTRPNPGDIAVPPVR
jgi:probable phosphoglycerate mutase